MAEKKKHILVLSQYFHPEPFRINDMCLEWVKRGYKVTVVTGIPNYPQGKFYKGYSWFKGRREDWNGVRIIRIPLIPRGHSSLGLVLNYFSFVVSGFFWKCFTKVKADYVFMFEVSPMTQCLVGVWYAKRRKIPCYLYVQDLWPENVEIVTGIHNKVILGSIGKMVDYIYKRCDHIFATSPSFVTEIQKRCAEREKDKVTYWPQYAEEFYQPVERNRAFALSPEIPNDGSFKIIFTGNIGQAQGLDILPKAAASLKGKNLCFVIVGDGRNKADFVNQIEEYGVSEMFLMIDRQPAERIPAMLCCCDAAFVSFMDNPLFAKTIPAKLQSYMACGMPIIASASGETKRVIEEADCGLCCGIGDVVQLSEKIQMFMALSFDERERVGKNARRYYEDNFRKQKLMDEIKEFFSYGEN